MMQHFSPLFNTCSLMNNILFPNEEENKSKDIIFPYAAKLQTNKVLEDLHCHLKPTHPAVT